MGEKNLISRSICMSMQQSRRAQESGEDSLQVNRIYQKKILKSEWKPDYAETLYNAFSGQTVIGIREFSVASYQPEYYLHQQSKFSSL
ncbi:MAG: hypothetical protein R3B47_12020 [Bacteroidia bacterium]